MGGPLIDFYRLPEWFQSLGVKAGLPTDVGYFQFRLGTTCFGRCNGRVSREFGEELYDVYADFETSGQLLPFDPADIVENLRLERYVENGSTRHHGGGAVGSLYYLVRPLLPVTLRKHLQRIALRDWTRLTFPAWPVDCSVERIHESLLLASMRSTGQEEVPFIWFWPDGLASCTMVTHDVETSVGRDFCSDLMDIDSSFGIKSSFQIVPERRYKVRAEFLSEIRRRGFEINIHGLNHDGRLFEKRDEFLRRARRINQYARDFGSRGFRSPVLYRNLDWIEELGFSYDMSVPNVGHLDPQRGGCCTVMPYFVGHMIELPLTTAQDYSLFYILDDYSTVVWRKQISIVQKNHGLISFNIHPDYLANQRAVDVYTELLSVLSLLATRQQTWIASPGEVETWWRQRSQMRIVRDRNRLAIVGPGADRARIANAYVRGNNDLAFEIEQPKPWRVTEITA